MYMYLITLFKIRANINNLVSNFFDILYKCTMCDILYIIIWLKWMNIEELVSLWTLQSGSLLDVVMNYFVAKLINNAG